jgi:ABC-type ATPase with predicted acetyltransferase domain
LSNGEQFRAGLARLICDAPDKVVVDEFTSVVDRQIAKIGASAFAKAWRKNKGKQIVLLSCHYDIIEWLQPDWVYDTRVSEVKKKSKNDHLSNSTFGRSTEVTGSFLKSIII